jgi:Bacterial capsule synthesis protein PGA_cap
MYKSRVTGLLIAVGLAVPACAQTGQPLPVAAPVAVSPSPATSFTVVTAGDLLVHPPLTDQAAADARELGRPGHDFTRVLAAVKPIVSAADLGVCHMETPLAPATGPFTGFPLFSVPPQLADAAADAGFDTCSTASNHSLDTGEEGIARTLAGLDRVGLKHTGTARSRAEAATPTIVDVRGVRVAHLSYTFSLNGIPLPEGKPWAANLIDPRAILAEARRARRAGADVVLLSLHWGTEYQHEADDGQLDLAAELLGNPEIDLIIGHHVHVVQPFQRIGGKWVAYGLGNLTTPIPGRLPRRHPGRGRCAVHVLPDRGCAVGGHRGRRAADLDGVLPAGACRGPARRADGVHCRRRAADGVPAGVQAHHVLGEFAGCPQRGSGGAALSGGPWRRVAGGRGQGVATSGPRA